MASQPPTSPSLTAVSYGDIPVGTRYYRDAAGLDSYVKSPGIYPYPLPGTRVYIKSAIPSQEDLIERPPLALAIRGRISDVVRHLEAQPESHVPKRDVLRMLQDAIRDIDRHLNPA